MGTLLTDVQAAEAELEREARQDPARAELERAVLRRTFRALRQAVGALATGSLAEAAAAADDFSAAVEVLADSGAVVAPTRIDPLVEALARGAEVRRSLLAESGGAHTAAQVATLLGVTRQAVEDRRRRGRLLAVTDERGGWHYPAVQFDPATGGVLPELEAALGALRVDDGWMRLDALLAPAVAPDGTPARVIDRLRDGDAAERTRLLAALGAWGDQGA